MANQCSVPDCPYPVCARGFCNRHYRRFLWYGDPLAPMPVRKGFRRATSLDEYLGDRYTQGPKDECWEWRGAIATENSSGGGYGRVDFGGRHCGAHVAVYEQLVGPIPEGLVLDHLCHSLDESCPGGPCRHRRCVNPSHLEPVTSEENLLRSHRPRGKDHHKGAVTHCPRGHEYDEANTYVFRGGRLCRACHLIHNRAHKAKKRRERAG